MICYRNQFPESKGEDFYCIKCKAFTMAKNSFLEQFRKYQEGNFDPDCWQKLPTNDWFYKIQHLIIFGYIISQQYKMISETPQLHKNKLILLYKDIKKIPINLSFWAKYIKFLLFKITYIETYTGQMDVTIKIPSLFNKKDKLYVGVYEEKYKEEKKMLVMLIKFF